MHEHTARASLISVPLEQLACVPASCSMALSEAAYVLSQRYEDRLFAPQGSASKGMSHLRLLSTTCTSCDSTWIALLPLLTTSCNLHLLLQ